MTLGLPRLEAGHSVRSRTTRARSRRCAGDRAPGFTLLEVTIVVSLLVLLSVMIWPAVDNWLHAAALPESADNVRATMRMARASAGLNHRRYRIRFERDVQQPFVEYEVDPMKEPGRWDPVKEPWSDNDILLEDVQVVRVIPGRPEYMTPVSHASGSGVEELFNESLGTDTGLFDETTNGSNPGQSYSLEKDDEQDPDRPTIVFEPDGSCDWCTVIVAREKPGTKMDTSVAQRWIVLDGRTGLPRFQEPLSESQLADATLRPDLDKLQPPPSGLDTGTSGTGLDQLAGGLGQDALGGLNAAMGNAGMQGNGQMPMDAMGQQLQAFGGQDGNGIGPQGGDSFGKASTNGGMTGSDGSSNDPNSQGRFGGRQFGNRGQRGGASNAGRTGGGSAGK